MAVVIAVWTAFGPERKHADFTADARYMKGQTLVKMGKRTSGAAEFRQLIKEYPRSEQAVKAQAQLKQLGLSAATPARRK